MKSEISPDSNMLQFNFRVIYATYECVFPPRTVEFKEATGNRVVLRICGWDICANLDLQISRSAVVTRRVSPTSLT